MTIKKLAAALAATSLLASPVLAQSADSLRTPSPTKNSEKLEGSSGILIALLAAAAVIAGIIVLAGDDDADDLPVSP